MTHPYNLTKKKKKQFMAPQMVELLSDILHHSDLLEIIS